MPTWAFVNKRTVAQFRKADDLLSLTKENTYRCRQTPVNDSNEKNSDKHKRKNYNS